MLAHMPMYTVWEFHIYCQGRFEYSKCHRCTGHKMKHLVYHELKLQDEIQIGILYDMNVTVR